MPKSAKPEAILADASLAQSRKTAPVLKRMLEFHQHHGHSEQSVREDDYRGHHIVVKTTYEVTVDGKPFHASLGVSNAGNVQYHGLPNIGFASAIDLIRCVIDQFPAEFPKPKGKTKTKPAPHDHMMHMTSAPRKAVRKAARKGTR